MAVHAQVVDTRPSLSSHAAWVRGYYYMYYQLETEYYSVYVKSSVTQYCIMSRTYNCMPTHTYCTHVQVQCKLAPWFDYCKFSTAHCATCPSQPVPLKKAMVHLERCFSTVQQAMRKIDLVYQIEFLGHDYIYMCGSPV